MADQEVVQGNASGCATGASPLYERLERIGASLDCLILFENFGTAQKQVDGATSPVCVGVEILGGFRDPAL